MFVVLFCVLLYYIVTRLINDYVTILLSLVYALSYFDNKEYTGERHWPAFRRLRVWRWFSPIQATITNETDLSALQHDSMRLYVLIPGETLIAAVWGFGLHGGVLRAEYAEKLHYVVPPILLWIPLLRDLLLWSGAVTWHPRKRPLNGVIIELLQSGRSVCYVPSQCTHGMHSVRDGDEEHLLEGSYLEAAPLIVAVPDMDGEIVSFLRQKAVQLVPVMITKERQRYYIARWRWLQRIQQWSVRQLLYPLPFIFWLRLTSRRKPPILQQQFGPILHCKTYRSDGELLSAFREATKRLSCAELGDDLYVFAE